MFFLLAAEQYTYEVFVRSLPAADRTSEYLVFNGRDYADKEHRLLVGFVWAGSDTNATSRDAL